MLTSLSVTSLNEFSWTQGTGKHDLQFKYTTYQLLQLNTAGIRRKKGYNLISNTLPFTSELNICSSFKVTGVADVSKGDCIRLKK